MIYIIETIDAIEGRTSELKQMLSHVVSLSRAEKGCTLYELYQDSIAHNRFALIMCFINEEAYQEHISADYIQELEKYYNIIYHNVIETRYSKIS